MDIVIANLAIEEIAQAVDFRHGQSFGEAHPLGLTFFVINTTLEHVMSPGPVVSDLPRNWTHAKCYRFLLPRRRH